jgi:hypothetical protein
MKVNFQLSKIIAAAKKGQFIAFDYTKETGEKSHRVVRFGGDIAKRLEKSGTPINGKGSWMTGHASGLRGMVIRKNGKRYVRGTDVTDSKHKVFLVSGISMEGNGIKENK